MSDFENISEITNEGFPILNKRYSLLKKIGEGSYGVVYKASDKNKNNSLVAIKQISKMRINSNAYLIEALQKEINIMRLLSDENSVKLIENFETSDYYYLVMELCDSDLDIELKKHKSETKKGFNELEVQAIMNQFNKIFYKMQKEHVIHRDLKLKNIMIKYNKNVEIINFIVKLSDFGFSKVMNEEDITGTNLGSPATKAPEIMKGSEYNAKADLWSIGVIMFQLFFDQLPFPARTVRELKEAIFNARGVRLPIGKEDSMTQICFDLINSLLQKDPKKRIDFKEYFNHEFFSEKHKKYLIEKLKSKEKNEKIVYKEIIDENIIREAKTEEEEEDSNISGNNKSNNNKIFDLNVNKTIDFEKRFIKIMLIKEYKIGYKLYKAKDIIDDKFVFIKEFQKTIIDNNPINKKIFSKEINLLTELKGKKFPDYYGLFISDNYYNLVIEYFEGDNLYNFINKRNHLNEKLIILILKQLKSSLIELNEKNKFLEFISPKNFAFSFYINNTNFEIKFFDYGLYAIFEDEKFIKQYLLEESKLGNDEKNISMNILSMGLTVYKMFFGEEAIVIKSEEDYEIKSKGKIDGNNFEKIKFFLSRCIKKNKRYNWKEFYFDDFLNIIEFDSYYLSKIENKREPLIKDEVIETILEIICKKLKYIIDFYDNIMVDKETDFNDEIYINLLEEINIYLLFCSLECKTIIKFLTINADTPKEKIDENDQDIQLFQIFINKNDKDINKYDYSHINFLAENKNNLIYLYNKENPSFKPYLDIFSELEKKISIILKKLDEKRMISNLKPISDIPLPNYNNEIIESNQSQNLNKNKNNKTKSDRIYDLYNIDRNFSKKGNLEKLFTYYFEDGVFKYTNQNKDKAIRQLKLAKFILENVIFQRIILGNKDKTINFEKVIINSENKEESEKEDMVIFTTFIGKKIRKLKETGIIGYNSGSINENLNDYNDPKFENIKIYDNMINFYPRIIQFISEIDKEHI